MILARGTDGTLLIGLSRENITRLQAGQPIVISKDRQGFELPPEIPRIGILYGETEAAITEQLTMRPEKKPV